MISNGFVINPYKELLPDYKICPFSTDYIRINKKINSSSKIIEDYCKSRFFNKNYLFTENGREAINIALSYFNLGKNDCITILTTSGNFYISSCVTNEIEKFCSWSRKFEKNTRLIFVNHEFGFPFTNLSELKKYGLPIIEDCAHSFYSKDDNGDIGAIGDFIIYSFPKIFPVQYGGLLVTPKRVESLKPSSLNFEATEYLKKIVSYNIQNEKNIIKKRIRNYNYLKYKFFEYGIKPRFDLKKGIVPGVFMFKCEKINIELPELKKIYYSNGVQCSVFYGEKSFYIPCHQNLCETDLDYFFEIIKPFISK